MCFWRHLVEHGVPKAQLKNLRGLLENPALVFESDTQPGRLLLVTEAVVNGSPVVVAVEPNGTSGRLEVVYLPSMYPRKDAQWKFPQWIRAGKLKYADKSRSRLLATTAGLELPGVVQRSVGFTPAKYMTEADVGQAGMSRSRSGSMTETAVRKVADAIAARWNKAPTIIVVPNMQDMRVPEAARLEDARQRAAGAAGVPRGFYYQGTVYLVADGLVNIDDAAQALFHEALGHYGLSSVFGADLLPILVWHRPRSHGTAGFFARGDHVSGIDSNIDPTAPCSAYRDRYGRAVCRTDSPCASGSEFSFDPRRQRWCRGAAVVDSC